jgi:hypothetical protein
MGVLAGQNFWKAGKQGVDFKKKPEDLDLAVVVTGLLREVDPMLVVDGIEFLDENELLNNEEKQDE